jgi:hypothetical protein
MILLNSKGKSGVGGGKAGDDDEEIDVEDVVGGDEDKASEKKSKKSSKKSKKDSDSGSDKDILEDDLPF